jgi:hypothetical protein
MRLLLLRDNLTARVTRIVQEQPSMVAYITHATDKIQHNVGALIDIT